MNIQLTDRTLWADGVSVVNPKDIATFILKFTALKQMDKLAVSELTHEIGRYNLVAENPLRVKTELKDFSLDWTLPESYKYDDLDEYLSGLINRIEHDELYEARVARLQLEIELFKKHQLEDVLRVLIYVIDKLNETNSVWGVGRGSSCSSYLLFLLGLHEVDAVKYDIDITDFIRDGE